jgi:hypothetical protein
LLRMVLKGILKALMLEYVHIFIYFTFWCLPILHFT